MKGHLDKVCQLGLTSMINAAYKEKENILPEYIKGIPKHIVDCKQQLH